jgi:hypothetical protein
MDGQRQLAYRWLLYEATLHIRPLRYIKLGWWERLNPFAWRQVRSQVRVAGYLSEWLHNLALISAINFERFDEERFWKDYQWMLAQHPNPILQSFRAKFERYADPQQADVTANSRELRGDSLT